MAFITETSVLQFNKHMLECLHLFYNTVEAAYYDQFGTRAF
jgi:hypothetical protein